MSFLVWVSLRQWTVLQCFVESKLVIWEVARIIIFQQGAPSYSILSLREVLRAVWHTKDLVI